jgi:uncharacterized protein with FMN-binding domain
MSKHFKQPIRSSNQAIKKVIVSFIIVGSFVLYSFFHSRSDFAATLPGSTDTITDSTTNTPSTSATATISSTAPSGGKTPTATATKSSGSIYKDGSFTGKVTSAQWGNVQVKAVISNGKITSVVFLQHPDQDNRSVQINQRADPILVQEAIQAQSANVNIVSGATLTSNAFIASLSDALAQAKK